MTLIENWFGSNGVMPRGCGDSVPPMIDKGIDLDRTLVTGGYADAVGATPD